MVSQQCHTSRGIRGAHLRFLLTLCNLHPLKEHENRGAAHIMEPTGLLAGWLSIPRIALAGAALLRTTGADGTSCDDMGDTPELLSGDET